jgi:hypothetical protein
MDSLPDEILTYLQSFLAREDLLNFRSLCKYISESPKDIEQINKSKLLRDHKKLFANCLRRIRRIFYDINEGISCRHSDKISRLYTPGINGLLIESSNQGTIDRVLKYRYKYMYVNIGTYVNDNDKEYVTERPIFYHYEYPENYSSYMSASGKKYKLNMRYSIFMHYVGKNRGLGFVRNDSNETNRNNKDPDEDSDDNLMIT